MAAKAIFYVVCLFGAFIQIQSAAIDTAERSSEYKQDVRYPQIEVDGKQFKLTVKQRLHEVFVEKTPVWSIQSSDNEKGYEVSEIPFEKEQVNGLFYSDDEHMATLLASYDVNEDGQGYFDGVINIGTKVHKVEKVAEDWWTRPDLEAKKEKEVEAPENNEQKDENEPQNFKLRSAHVRDNNEHEVLDNALETFYPKILAVVDYDLYNKFEQNVDKIIEYVATFWNAVDLAYSKINSPAIKIVVTGVLIVKDEHVNVAELKDFNTNFAKDMSFTDYDAAFILTKSSVEAKQGQAHLGSICNRQYSVAFVQDNANYEGLLSATHELGHLLDIPHDGLDKADKCSGDSENNVTFMSTGLESTKALTWSQCSRNIIQEFAKSKAAACLENYWRYD